MEPNNRQHHHIKTATQATLIACGKRKRRMITEPMDSEVARIQPTFVEEALEGEEETEVGRNPR